MLASIRISATEATQQFQRFLSDIGFDLTGYDLVLDGKWRNVRLIGQRGYAKSGGYVGWIDDCPQGFYRNHKTGDHGRWEPAGERVPIHPSEAARLQAIWRERETARRLDEEQRHQARAEVAQRIMARAGEASPEHPYLKRKGIGVYGIHQIRDVLVIPLIDPADGKIYSAQFISSRGEKLLLRGGRKSGLSFMIGEPLNGGEIGIAEGYSSAASMHEALGIPVAMAINSGNLLPAARSLRTAYPNSPILIAGDNDIGLTHRTPALRNVGLEKATEAARQVAGRVSVPESERISQDWNDVMVKLGREATAAAIRRQTFQPT